MSSLVCYPNASSLHEVVVLENMWLSKKEVSSFVCLYLAFGKRLPDDIIDYILSFSRHRAVDACVWRKSMSTPTIYQITMVRIAHTLLHSQKRATQSHHKRARLR